MDRRRLEARKKELGDGLIQDEEDPLHYDEPRFEVVNEYLDVCGALERIEGVREVIERYDFVG